MENRAEEKGWKWGDQLGDYYDIQARYAGSEESAQGPGEYWPDL